MIEWVQAAAWGLCSTPLLGAGYAGFFAWRARRRNAAGTCGHCAGPQYAAPAYDPPALVQGRLVCGPCAARSRRRTAVALATAGTLSGVAVLATATAAVVGAGGWALPVMVTVEYAAVFGGAVAWMKRRNRSAGLALGTAGGPGSLPVPAPAASGDRGGVRVGLAGE